MRRCLACLHVNIVLNCSKIFCLFTRNAYVNLTQFFVILRGTYAYFWLFNDRFKYVQRKNYYNELQTNSAMIAHGLRTTRVWCANFWSDLRVLCVIYSSCKTVHHRSYKVRLGIGELRRVLQLGSFVLLLNIKLQ